jgi:hypothetical protein
MQCAAESVRVKKWGSSLPERHDLVLRAAGENFAEAPHRCWPASNRLKQYRRRMEFPGDQEGTAAVGAEIP